MKTIVHCSGYSLAEDWGYKQGSVLDHYGKVAERGGFGDWAHVCWGSQTLAALGRIPMSIWLARKVSADQIIWSTGCTKEAELGRWEAQVMLDWAFNHRRLVSDFPNRFSGRFLPREAIYHRWLKRISMLDTDSTTTSSSMAWLAAHLRDMREPVLVYLVSSANHASRVLRDVMVANEYDGGFRRVTFAAVPAGTSYGKKRVFDTVVTDLG